MKKEAFEIGGVPAVLYGESTARVCLFVHGRCGCKEEGEAVAAQLDPLGWQVLAVDLPEHGARQGGTERFLPWVAVPELRATLAFLRARWDTVALRANSIGAWFSMLAYPCERFDRCLFVSPTLCMEGLVTGMMRRAGVSEEILRERGSLPDGAGGELSWEYLCYIREHPADVWEPPTAILCAGRDEMTPREVFEEFCRRNGASLTVMEDGEHWFHTPEQLAVLGEWTEKCFSGGNLTKM